MSFIIKCKKCGKEIELFDGFDKRGNDILVYDSGEFLVSLECRQCGNEVVSDYED